jgi:hypothetical protein
MALWFLVFGCGTLINSRDYRLVTDTDFRAQQLKLAAEHDRHPFAESKTDGKPRCIIRSRASASVL